jgi:hypothetical protein
MGFITARRIREFVVSRERAWDNFEEDDANFYRGVSRCVGYYPPGKTISDWARLVRREERSLAEAGR